MNWGYLLRACLILLLCVTMKFQNIPLPIYSSKAWVQFFHKLEMREKENVV